MTVEISNPRALTIGVWGCYTEHLRENYLFLNTDAGIGSDLLLPFNRLHRLGLQKNISFKTLDTLAPSDTLDALLFLDRPSPEDAIANSYLAHFVGPKFLLLFENRLVRPQNWDADYHRLFSRIFTWNDDLADRDIYRKINFSTDLAPVHPFPRDRSEWTEKQTCSLISIFRSNPHPESLYNQRIVAAEAAQAVSSSLLEIWGKGWSQERFPNYRGPARCKLEVLSKYRFSLCFENFRGLRGYITEKIFDCFKAGTVPIYWGAENVHQWIPPDCFIDARAFRSFDDLWKYVEGISWDTYQLHARAIENFLSGAASGPFSIETFCNTLLDEISSGIEASGSPLTTVSPPQPTPQKHSFSMPNPQEQTLSTGYFRQFSELTHPSLIVTIGYDPDVYIYRSARHFWDFYKSFFPNIHFLFVRETHTLTVSESHHDGRDLVIGTKDFASSHSGSVDRSQPDSSRMDHGRLIFRQIALYHHLLSSVPSFFLVFHCNITSVVDFRGLLHAIRAVNSGDFFAGMPYKLTGPDPLTNLTFASGAGTILSRPAIEKLVARYDASSWTTQLPNDVWQAVLLPDVPRTVLPMFSFVREVNRIPDLEATESKVRQLLQFGHFHFRVKSGSEPPVSNYPRELVDQFLLYRIASAIIGHEFLSEKVDLLLQSLRLFCSGTLEESLPSYDPRPLLQFPRTFPLNDKEF